MSFLHSQAAIEMSRSSAIKLVTSNSDVKVISSLTLRLQCFFREDAIVGAPE